MEKVEIICKKHGLFNQTPNTHLIGRGCPKCKKSKGELFIENYLIDNKINYKTQYKFEDLKDKKHLQFDFGTLQKRNLKKD